MTKRIAAKEIGGRSRSPTLIASHVELQTTQRAAKARTIPILFSDGGDAGCVFTDGNAKADYFADCSTRLCNASAIVSNVIAWICEP